jgi:raffinose/stachyose/melibiose transport system permease protein
MIAGQIGFGILIARALNANIKGKTFFRAWFFFQRSYRAWLFL